MKYSVKNKAGYLNQPCLHIDNALKKMLKFKK